MRTNDKIDNEIDKKLKELDIVKAINPKDVPYVIMQVRGLLNEVRAEGYSEGYRKGRKDAIEYFEWVVTKKWLKELAPSPNDIETP